jgi:hypothetical protein
MIETNPLLRLIRLGQSVWLDDLRRIWLQGGRLAQRSAIAHEIWR